MKSLPPALQSHLDTGTTTLAWCWRLTRRDGTRLGFTDHDRDLAFDGTTFEAATGFTATEIKDAVGLSVDNLEVSSALQLRQPQRGRPRRRPLRRRGHRDLARQLGRHRPARADALGLARRGAPLRPRLHRRGARPRPLPAAAQGPPLPVRLRRRPRRRPLHVDLDDPAFRGTGTVVAASSLRLFTASGLDSFAADWFTRGLVTFTSGANAGRAQEVKRHARRQPATLELWQPMAHAIAPGDAFTVTAGCDKQFATCQAKFANAVNFRGFPHMPGNDFVTAVARPGDPANDGRPAA